MLPVNLIGLLMGALSAWVLSQGLATLSVAATSLNAVANPAVTAPWFASRYDLFTHIAAALAVPLLFLAALHALRRQEPRVLLRALGAVPLAALFTQQGVGAVVLLTSLVDTFSRSMLQGSTGSILGSVAILSARLAPDAALGATGGGMASSILVLLAGSIIALGAVALWVELLLRGLTIDVAVLFLPIAFVGIIWAPTELWIRRLGTLILGLISAKLVIAAVLDLGIGAFATAASNPLSAVFTGGTLLILAAFAPWGLLRLIPFIQEAAFALNEQKTQLRAAASRLHLPDIGQAGTDLLRARIAQAALDEPFPGGSGASEVDTNDFDSNGFGENRSTTPSTDPVPSGFSAAAATSVATPLEDEQHDTETTTRDFDQREDLGSEVVPREHSEEAQHHPRGDTVGPADRPLARQPAQQTADGTEDASTAARSVRNPIPETDDVPALQADSQNAGIDSGEGFEDASTPPSSTKDVLRARDARFAQGSASDGSVREAKAFDADSLTSRVAPSLDGERVAAAPPWGDNAAPSAPRPGAATAAAKSDEERKASSDATRPPVVHWAAPWGNFASLTRPASETPNDKLDAQAPQGSTLPTVSSEGGRAERWPDEEEWEHE